MARVNEKLLEIQGRTVRVYEDRGEGSVVFEQSIPGKTNIVKIPTAEYYTKYNEWRKGLPSGKPLVFKDYVAGCEVTIKSYTEADIDMTFAPITKPLPTNLQKLHDFADGK